MLRPIQHGLPQHEMVRSTQHDMVRSTQNDLSQHNRVRRTTMLALCGILVIVILIFSYQRPYYTVQPSEVAQGDTKQPGWLFWLNSSPPDDPQTTRKCPLPLKVYMYDIPRKFNFGLLTMHGKNGDVPWGNNVAPPWSQKWEVNKQHSVEYWMTVYLLDGWDRKDGKRAAVRVRDPEQAEVFFVPFFASLAFNNLGYNMTGPGAELERKLQGGVVDFLMKSEWWNASQGRDHVIVIHHPNAFRHYHEFLKSSMFIVADFGRYPVEIARLEKDIVAPYDHVVRSYIDDSSSDPFSQRHTLLYFQGRVRRKDGGVVRTALHKVLMNERDVHYVDSEASSAGLAEATIGMRSSRFCLHPAGDTPSSCRLFDAIVSHCIPVVVSDKIELPFEDDIDYSEFALFFSTTEAVKPGHLVRTLRRIQREQWTQMWTKLKAVSHHFEFQHPAIKDDAVNMIFKQVQRKLPAMKLAAHRSGRLKIADWW